MVSHAQHGPIGSRHERGRIYPGQDCPPDANLVREEMTRQIQPVGRVMPLTEMVARVAALTMDDVKAAAEGWSMTRIMHWWRLVVFRSFWIITGSIPIHTCCVILMICESTCVGTGSKELWDCYFFGCNDFFNDGL